MTQIRKITAIDYFKDSSDEQIIKSMENIPGFIMICRGVALNVQMDNEYLIKQHKQKTIIN